MCVLGGGREEVGCGEASVHVGGLEWGYVGYGCGCGGGRVRGGKSGDDGCNRGWNQLLSSTTHTIFRSKRNDLRTSRHADSMDVT